MNTIEIETCPCETDYCGCAGTDDCECEICECGESTCECTTAGCGCKP